MLTKLELSPRPRDTAHMFTTSEASVKVSEDAKKEEFLSSPACPDLYVPADDRNLQIKQLLGSGR